jgi:pimeloyl-ACP methyl ester carboxylesterase
VELTPLLKQSDTPTLLHRGDKDAVIPLSNASDDQAAIANSVLVTLPGLGHVPHEEDSASALRPVQEFLDRRP